MCKLKRCPFCGGEPIISKYDPYDGYQGDCTIYRIQCRRCGVTVKCSFRDTAIILWNKRVKEIDLDEPELIRLMMSVQYEYKSLCDRCGSDYSGAIALSKILDILSEVYHGN